MTLMNLESFVQVMVTPLFIYFVAGLRDLACR